MCLRFYMMKGDNQLLNLVSCSLRHLSCSLLFGFKGDSEAYNFVDVTHFDFFFSFLCCQMKCDNEACDLVHTFCPLLQFSFALLSGFSGEIEVYNKNIRT